MRPNYSHYSRENATPSSGTSPITCCKREPPPPPGAFSMALRIKDKDVQMLNLYWKESTSLFQSGVMSRLVCLIFPINDLFFCCLFMQCLLLNFVSSDCRKWLSSKNIQPLLTSSILRPSLFCFGFDFNQSQCAKPVSRNAYGSNSL